jgi:hypothetical protein
MTNMHRLCHLLCSSTCLNCFDSSDGPPIEVEIPEAKLPEIVPLSEQKLSDGSAFKGNAAGYLERRSDIIKSWYASHTNLNQFAIPSRIHFLFLQGAQICSGSRWRRRSL